MASLGFRLYLARSSSLPKAWISGNSRERGAVSRSLNYRARGVGGGIKLCCGCLRELPEAYRGEGSPEPRDGIP